VIDFAWRTHTHPFDLGPFPAMEKGLLVATLERDWKEVCA
jgi:hypothetical protein